MEILNVYTDGASRGNPGPASLGIVFKNEQGNVIWKKHQVLGKKTNNEAEYEALIEAMKHVNRYHPQKICFYADSKLMIEQMKGDYRITQPSLQRLFLKAWNKKIVLKNKAILEFKAIPREQNKEADQLANQALDQQNLGI
jgi:ribonuclease HI